MKKIPIGYRYKIVAKKLLGFLHSEEILYAIMTENGLLKKKIETPALYPTKGAANYSLLYVILRSLSELPVSNVLELGIGQSTLLLDALSAPGLSIEHDAGWANILRSRVRNRSIATAPLVSSTVRGVQTMVYDVSPPRSNMLIIDGPQGSLRKSRWGALKLVEESLEDEFLIVVDDAGRRGELDLAREILEMTGADCHFISGLSSQCLIFTKAFQAAAWF